MTGQISFTLCNIELGSIVEEWLRVIWVPEMRMNYTMMGDTVNLASTT